MVEYLEENKLGTKKVNYKIENGYLLVKDIGNEPVPVIHMEDGTIKLVSDEELPLTLPVMDDYKKGKNGMAPLENATKWENVVIDGMKGKKRNFHYARSRRLFLVLFKIY